MFSEDRRHASVDSFFEKSVSHDYLLCGVLQMRNNSIFQGAGGFRACCALFASVSCIVTNHFVSCSFPPAFSLRFSSFLFSSSLFFHLRVKSSRENYTYSNTPLPYCIAQRVCSSFSPLSLLSPSPPPPTNRLRYSGESGIL